MKDIQPEGTAPQPLADFIPSPPPTQKEPNKPLTIKQKLASGIHDDYTPTQIEDLVDEMINLRKSRYASLNRENYITILQSLVTLARIEEWESLIKATNNGDMRDGVKVAEYITNRLDELKGLK